MGVCSRCVYLTYLNKTTKQAAERMGETDLKVIKLFD